MVAVNSSIGKHTRPVSPHIFSPKHKHCFQQFTLSADRVRFIARYGDISHVPHSCVIFESHDRSNIQLSFSSKEQAASTGRCKVTIRLNALERTSLLPYHLDIRYEPNLIKTLSCKPFSMLRHCFSHGGAFQGKKVAQSPLKINHCQTRTTIDLWKRKIDSLCSPLNRANGPHEMPILKVSPSLAPERRGSVVSLLAYQYHCLMRTARKCWLCAKVNVNSWPCAMWLQSKVDQSI